MAKLMKKLEALFWLVVFILVGIVMTILHPLVDLIGAVAAIGGKGKVARWGKNVWVGKDNYGSAQYGGDPDETMSSRLGKARRRGSGWGFIANKVDLVAAEFFNDLNHCEKSIEDDEGSHQVTNY